MMLFRDTEKFSSVAVSFSTLTTTPIKIFDVAIDKPTLYGRVAGQVYFCTYLIVFFVIVRNLIIAQIVTLYYKERHS